jgi:Lsr2
VTANLSRTPGADTVATETTTRLVDDLDGGAAERTVELSWDGHGYEIDLSQKDISALEKVLKPHLAGACTARPTSDTSRRRETRTTAASTKRADLQTIRDWACANGHEVSDRGRIPASIVGRMRPHDE